MLGLAENCLNAARYQLTSCPQPPGNESIYGNLSKSARAPMASLTSHAMTKSLNGKLWLPQTACSFVPPGTLFRKALSVGGSCRPWCDQSDDDAPSFEVHCGRRTLRLGKGCIASSRSSRRFARQPNPSVSGYRCPCHVTGFDSCRTSLAAVCSKRDAQA